MEGPPGLVGGGLVGVVGPPGEGAPVRGEGWKGATPGGEWRLEVGPRGWKEGWRGLREWWGWLGGGGGAPW